MFRLVDDFLTIWKQEATHTLNVLAAIPDGKAGQAVAEEHRDLRRMAWHLTECVAEMPSNMGIHVQGFEGKPYETAPPDSMARIREVYSGLSDSLLQEAAKLNNMALAATYDYYGMKWTGAYALWILVTHQTHHRGQMTVLMRQAGLKVPDTYGPAKEGWDAYGMPSPTV
jgi:uncharacterized damage-inducible protein DinB